MSLIALHVVAVSAWIGVVAAESVMELYAREPELLRHVARIHKRIDLFFEGPLIVLVLTTGTILLVGEWPVSPLILLKVGLGLTAVIANSICIPLVFLRAEATDDAAILQRSHQIRATGIAIPAAVAALLIGLSAA